MRGTRKTVNLKNTSIHEHLLKDKTRRFPKTHQELTKNMIDNKDTVLLTNNPTYQSQNTPIDNENGHSCIKSSNEISDSIISTNNNNQKMLSTLLQKNQFGLPSTTNEKHSQLPEEVMKLSITDDVQVNIDIPLFSGNKNEDPGQWLDQVFMVIERKNLTSTEQRDIAAAKLSGEALFWYRCNRLTMPDMQSFVHQLLLTYNAPRKATVDNNTIHQNRHYNYSVEQGTMIENDQEQLDDNTAKSIIECNQDDKPLSRSLSPLQVLQSARNEKVKSFPNFSGTENSLYWLKNLQQIGKTLKLNDQQMYELATIKLSGPAQEWFYHQGDEINDWVSFKEVFLYAFPSPIQPTDIDYLAQLLARKQGETEPVGKFIQDINRLCLKLDNRITEQEKLQYLRRGLRPQLQHYALSITSLQDFLIVMQRHEQIEKEATINQQLSLKTSSKSSHQQPWFDRPSQHDRSYYQNQASTKSKSSDHYHSQNSYSTRTPARLERDARICYQCNKRGHIQWDCPDNNSWQQQYQGQQVHYDQQQDLEENQQPNQQHQHFQQRSH